MTKKSGIICISIGVILIILSIGFYIFNESENKTAQDNSDKVIPQIISAQQSNSENDYENLIEPDTVMLKTIDGYDYIGYLSIPSLDLDLPVMADCDDTRLKLAPCRYYGWAKDDTMVIAGHNYKSHFGRLSRLNHGDEVIFTDMCNKVYKYSVADIEVLPPSASQEMVQSSFDLTLYTCTYSSNDRITIRCTRVK